LPQLYELIEKYEPQVLFTDGDWLDPYTLWRSPEFLDWLLNESPVKDSIVINDRWGKVRKQHGGYYTTEYGAGLKDSDRPWEENRGIGFSFGYNRNETLEDYSSAKKLIFMLADIVSRGGNFLLDIGPTADGRIPVIMEDRLIEIGRWLKINGEAIYGTRQWRRDAQWSEGINPGFDATESIDDRRHGGYDIFRLTIDPPAEHAVKELLFTQKDGNVFAMMPAWPANGVVRIKDINVNRDTVVTLLGHDEPLRYRRKKGGIDVTLPEVVPGRLPSDAKDHERGLGQIRLRFCQPAGREAPAESDLADMIVVHAIIHFLQAVGREYSDERIVGCQLFHAFLNCLHECVSRRIGIDESHDHAHAGCVQVTAQ
jgi:alpha-L-fucosidase